MIIVLAVEDIRADLREEVLQGMLVLRKIGVLAVHGTFLIRIVRVITAAPQHRDMILDHLCILHEDTLLPVMRWSREPRV